MSNRKQFRHRRPMIVLVVEVVEEWQLRSPFGGSYGYHHLWQFLPTRFGEIARVWYGKFGEILGRFFKRNGFQIVFKLTSAGPSDYSERGGDRSSAVANRKKLSSRLTLVAMNPLRLFTTDANSRASRHEAHMTWASRSISHSVSRARIFLKRQIWVWPIIAVVVLSIAGFVVRNSIESTIKGNLTSGLKTLVTLEASMLENFFEVHQSTAESLATDAQVRNLAYSLLEQDREPTADSLNGEIAIAETSKQLAKELSPAMSSHDYTGFFVTDKSNTIVAASNPALIGQGDIPEYESFLSSALDGKANVCPPFSSVASLQADPGKYRVGQPTMYVAAPIRDESFQVIGVLALRIRPEDEFTQILQLGQVGETGETYAFNRDGLMVSNSRFDEEMILLGLLADKKDSASILNIEVRDPGGNMTTGYRPTVRRGKMPLTKMAQAATAGDSGVDVEGYRDYRGVPVVGAWVWLNEYDIGVVTEVDLAQAFRPLVILRRVFWTLYSMLILCSIAIFVFTLLVARARRDAQKAAIDAQQLGQYTLDEKLGSGAMGVVYRGHHAMMRRPTAIKMLNVDRVDETSIARFEREVNVTCKLTHPNTIAIYDYGRTPEGVFYYAMEFIEGIDLQSLVNEYGPQPPNRVIHLLTQMCGSLFEAHSLGLVHRDVKPANTMLCMRGCEPDVIKVLDFGLVKAIDEEHQSGDSGGLTGTPLYMSPEAIQSPLTVDARSDLYAVGAVGYFLLTGRSVFEAESFVELCQKQVDETPVSPSELCKEAISEELEYAIMTCLEKSRAKRPQTARDLSLLLEKCPEAHQWTAQDGDAWWSRHSRRTEVHSSVSQTDVQTEKSTSSAPSSLDHLEQTIDH